MNVTWQPPLLPNGVITHYSLELWNSSHYLNLTSSTNNIHITHLRKYARYRVMVQAHTRAGPGNYSSEPLNITTLEDGERDGRDEEGLFSVPGHCTDASWLSSKGIWLNLTFLLSFPSQLHLSVSVHANAVTSQVSDATWHSCLPSGLRSTNNRVITTN